MATWFDLSVDNAETSWRNIRAIRADPPDAIRKRLKGERAKVFHMALEQSQQQFASANVIGHESRPLNLFYGLSQAGRAISAASIRLGNKPGTPESSTWSPSGHGLNFTGALGSGGMLDHTVTVKPTTHDSFSRLARALDSPTDLGDVQLGAVMSQILELHNRYPQYLRWPANLSTGGVHTTGPFEPGSKHQMEIALPGRDQTWTREEVCAYIKRYPALRKTEIVLDPTGAPLQSHNEGRIFLSVPAEALENVTGPTTAQLRAAGIYRNHRVILPALGASQDVLHPLASWWLVLFSLSMLSRYSPSDWSDVLDIRSSKIAAMVEDTLDIALAAVPQLIAESLHSLNSS
ncbi:YaaC family protein [Cryobacterium sp. TMT1-66-1]|uniref:YaaC family protein n=1 Tax=Cryobacterium sp. TMT1-66-1 TaxID=1259242 RepID=UPI00106B9F1B|nr:YaaC family protein [Cryobacterium sp. TMT1-66-1]TFD07001.1 hypothetical protein E3T29_08295 [Cryobacterium sp. TMT1-66-1]